MSTLSILAGVLFIIGFIPYIISILQKETKPAKATWIIWASLNIITILGMYYEHAINGQMLGAVGGAITVTLLSLRYGVPGWTKMDKFCLVGAIIGIALWQIFDNPTLGIVTSCIVAFIGSIPTFASAWENSGRENKFAWAIWWISCIFAIIAIPKWTLADAMPPFSFFIVDTIMVYLVLIRHYSTIRKLVKKIEK